MMLNTIEEVKNKPALMGGTNMLYTTQKAKAGGTNFESSLWYIVRLGLKLKKTTPEKCQNVYWKGELSF